MDVGSPWRDQTALVSLARGWVAAPGIDSGRFGRGPPAGLAAERPDVVGHVRDALLTGTLDGRRLQRIYRQAGRRNSVARARRDLDEGPTGQSDEPAPREAHEAGREDTPTGGVGSAAVIAIEQPAADDGDDEGDGDEVTHDESVEHSISTDELIQTLFVDSKATRVRAARQLSLRPEEPAVIGLGTVGWAASTNRNAGTSPARSAASVRQHSFRRWRPCSVHRCRVYAEKQRRHSDTSAVWPQWNTSARASTTPIRAFERLLQPR